MEKANAMELQDATIIHNNGHKEKGQAQGIYTVKCLDSKGKLRWEDSFDNLVTDVGANYLLDHTFGGAQNTTYFLGLISSVGYSAVGSGNTMGSHGTWNEAGNGSNFPTWSSPASSARQTVTWNGANARAKALASTANFTIATGGTIKGCFIVTGTGAVSTNNDTNGTLYSCGTFGSDKVVDTSYIVQVTYSTSA